VKPAAMFVLAASLIVRGQDADAQRRELAGAVQEANTSSMDMIAALEKFLRKYPDTALKPDIYKYLAKAAIDTKDDARTIRYGVPAVEAAPSLDINLLDRTTAALIRTGGKENATRALAYAKRIEDYVIRVPVPEGPEAAKNQEDHDRIVARVLLYQARANSELGNDDDARKQAALAFMAYPDSLSARTASDALERLGRHQEAIERRADAFAIPDTRATFEERAQDRRLLGEWYQKLHEGSEKGLGDEILAAYDRTSKAVEKELSQLRRLDPNLGLTDPMKYTLAALVGNKLELPSLRGQVVIFDFWATWCVPCRAQHPLYEEVKQRFRDRSDVVFLSVDTDEDHALVPGFLKEQNWSNQVYFDSGLVKLLAIDSIPSTMIADKKGRLVSRMDGYLADKFVDQLTTRIKAAIEGSAE